MHCHFVFTFCVSGWDNRIGPMFLSACQFVSALKAGPFDAWTQNIVQGLTLMQSRPSLMGKIIGQRSRGQKRDFEVFLIGWLDAEPCPMMWCRDVMWMMTVNSWHPLGEMHDAGGASTLAHFHYWNFWHDHCWAEFMQDMFQYSVIWF